jgi:galactose mutarotase-like enzyme
MITLSNERITVKINELGAEIRSLVCDGKECLWGGDPAIWSGTAPIMFPICGGLKEDKFTYNGKEYTLPKHGFAKTSIFEVEHINDCAATLLLRANDETKKAFPFDFEFRVMFEISDKTLKVDYKVDNKGSDTMYFNVGAHEAYATPEGIEDYDIVFDTEQTLRAHMLFGNLLAEDTYPIIKDTNVMPLYDKYFIIDALPFTDVTAGAATLRNRKNGRTVRVEFPTPTNFVLWHKHGAGYMCIEPWNGIPDMPGSSYDITEKKGITALGGGESYTYSHKITVND